MSITIHGYEVIRVGSSESGWLFLPDDRSEGPNPKDREAGDFIIIVIGVDDLSYVTFPTDLFPGYTKAAQAGTTISDSYVGVYYRKVTGTEDNAVWVPNGAYDYQVVTSILVSGVDPGAMKDISGFFGTWHADNDNTSFSTYVPSYVPDSSVLFSVCATDTRYLHYIGSEDWTLLVRDCSPLPGNSTIGTGLSVAYKAVTNGEAEKTTCTHTNDYLYTGWTGFQFYLPSQLVSSPSASPSEGTPSDSPSDSPSEGTPSDSPSEGTPSNTPSEGTPSEATPSGSPSEGTPSGTPSTSPSSGTNITGIHCYEVTSIGDDAGTYEATVPNSNTAGIDPKNAEEGDLLLFVMHSNSNQSPNIVTSAPTGFSYLSYIGTTTSDCFVNVYYYVVGPEGAPSTVEFSKRSTYACSVSIFLVSGTDPSDPVDYLVGSSGGGSRTSYSTPYRTDQKYGSMLMGFVTTEAYGVNDIGNVFFLYKEGEPRYETLYEEYYKSPTSNYGLGRNAYWVRATKEHDTINRAELLRTTTGTYDGYSILFITVNALPESTPSASPSEGTPSDSPSEGTPSGTPSDSPSEGTPSGSPSEGTPSEGTQSDSPSEGTPSSSPSEGTPSEGTPSSSPSDSPSEGTPSSSPSEGTPSETPSEGTPSEGTPSNSGVLSPFIFTKEDLSDPEIHLRLVEEGLLAYNWYDPYFVEYAQPVPGKGLYMTDGFAFDTKISDNPKSIYLFYHFDLSQVLNNINYFLQISFGVPNLSALRLYLAISSIYFNCIDIKIRSRTEYKEIYPGILYDPSLRTSIFIWVSAVITGAGGIRFRIHSNVNSNFESAVSIFDYTTESVYDPF